MDAYLQQQLYVQNGIYDGDQTTVLQKDHAEEMALDGDYAVEESVFLEKSISVELRRLLFKCNICCYSSLNLLQMKTHLVEVHNHLYHSNKECIYIYLTLSLIKTCVFLCHLFVNRASTLSCSLIL